MTSSNQFSMAYTIVPICRILYVAMCREGRGEFGPLSGERRGGEGLVVSGAIGTYTFDTSEVLLLCGEFVDPGSFEVRVLVTGL